MLHHLIELCLQLLGRFWPLILAVFILAPMIGLLALGIFLKRKMKQISQPPPPRPGQKSENKGGLMDSLHRLPKDKYQILSLIHVPRLDGKGITRIHHVVLSNFGIFVIQPQEQCGYITGGVGESNWTVDGQKGRKTFINPVIRNHYHVKALAKFLGLPEALFVSIIFFQSEVSFADSPPCVLSNKLGRHILSHTAPIISPEVLSQALTALLPMTGDYDNGTSGRVYDAEQVVSQNLANEQEAGDHIKPTAFSSAPGKTSSTSAKRKQPRKTSEKAAR
jgi:hypothetical protein